MPKYPVQLSLIGILLATTILLAACGGSGGGHPQLGLPEQPGLDLEQHQGTTVFQVVMQPQAELQEVPRGVSMVNPATMLAGLSPLPVDRDPSCTGSGFIIKGRDYVDDLPSANASRTGDEGNFGTFSPDYTPPDINSAAYALYRWNMRGYSGAQTIGFTWADGNEPADYSNLFIGLGNLDADRWNWYTGPQDLVLTIDSFGPYRAADGDMLMVVVLLGSDPATLIEMEAGVPEERSTGVEDDPTGSLDFPLLLNSGDLPASIDLSPACAPVNDQMTWGSCTAFGVGDGGYNYELNQIYRAYGWNLDNPKYRVSPKHLYIVSGELQGFPPGGGYGRWTSAVIDGLIDHGVASELNAPYDLVYSNDWSPAALADAAVLTIEDYREIPCNTWEGIDTVKAVLAQQRKVLPMQAYLDYSFMDYQAGDVWYKLGYTVGGHAMCIVGYDDSRGLSGAFKVRNSWSADWGDNGYVWIGCETFLDPSAAIRCWTITEEYSQAVIDHFNLEQPSGPPVTGVSAGDGTSAAGIEISWDQQAGATQYRVYRDEMTNVVTTLNAGTGSWLDTGIADSWGHVYWIRANDGQLSAPDTGYMAAMPEIKEISPTEVQEAADVTFCAAGLGSGPLTYAWDFGGAATPNTSSDARPKVAIGAPGQYSASLTLTNGLGSDNFEFELNVLPIPPIIEYIAGRSGFSGDLIYPVAHYTGTPTEYAWDFGGAAVPNTSSATEPAITLGAAGQYDARLEVTNGVTSDIYFFTITVLDSANKPWQTNGYDSRTSGQSPVNGPAVANLRWKLFVGDDAEYADRFNIYANPVFDSAGNIYFGVGGYDYHKSKVMSVTAGGEPRWTYVPEEENSDFNYVMITDDDLLVACTWGGDLYVLDLDGNEQWSVLGAVSFSSNPVVTDEGVVYFLSGDKYLYALNLADGTEHWPPFECSGKYNARSQLILAPNGILFFQGEWDYNWRLFAYNTITGAPAGSLYVKDPFMGFALSPDGITLYCTDEDGTVYAYDTSTCLQIWKNQDTRGESYDSAIGPRVGADGTVYGVNQTGMVYALDPDTGEMLWTCELGDQYNSYRSIPAIGRDGTLYLGSPTLNVFAVRDGSIVWTYPCIEPRQVTGDPSISPDGTLLISPDSGWLYAIGPGTGEELSAPFIDQIQPLSGDAGAEQTFQAYFLHGSEPISYAWDFRAGATPRWPTDPAPTVTLSEIGTYNCFVDVSNDYGASRFYFDLEVTDPSAPPQWYWYVVDAHPYDNGEAALIDGNPAFLGRKEGSGSADIIYFHSQVAEPTLNLDWDSEIVQDEYWTGESISMAVVEGKPAVAYKAEAGFLKYSYRTDTGWEMHDVLIEDYFGTALSLAVVDGKPAIAYAAYEAATYPLAYARSTAVAPSAGTDWVLSTITTPKIDSGFVDLIDNNGKPNVAFMHRDASDQFYIYYAQAASSTPVPADWSWYLFSDEVIWRDHLRLLQYGGLPLLVYTYDPGTAELRYARASVAVTSSPADWVTHALDNSASMSICDLLTIDGWPAMTYVGQTTDSYLGLARSDVAEPSAAGDWTVLHTVDDLDVLASLDVNGTPVIFAHLAGEGLIYMYLQ